MAEWKTLSLSSLIPEEVPAILGEASAIIESIAPILDAIAGAIDTTSALFIGFIDPIDELVSELRGLISGFTEEYLTSGVYFLTIPLGRFSSGYKQTVDDFISVFEHSLYDTSDPNRPEIFGTSGTTGVFVLANTESLGEIIDISTGLGDLFGAEELKIKGIIAELSLSAITATPVVGSLSPQTVELLGDTTLFPESGVVRIGDEITTYSGKTGTSLLGVISRTSHIAGEEVIALKVGGTPKGITVSLSTDIEVVGLETEIEVSSTIGFPSSGSFLIDDEEIFYTSKTDTSFGGCFPKETHSSGAPVVLRSGRSFVGSPPDWERILIGDLFIEFNYIIKYLDNLNAALEVATDIVEEMAEFARRIVAKMDKLRGRISALIETVSRFVELLSLTGVSVLTVTGTGTLDGFIEKVKSSEGKPEGKYTTGVVIIASASSSSKLLELFEG